MEIGNYIQRVLQRIQKVEPENATKIFGYLLLRHSLEELMGYAVGDEEQMHSLIAEAKFYLLPSLKLKPSEHLHPLPSFNRIPHLSFSSHSNLRAPAPRHQDHIPCNNEVWGMEDQLQPLSPSSFDLQGDNYLLDCGFGLGGQSQLSCHHFYNDYCRHGLGCNFSPGHSYSDSITQMPGVSLNDLTMEDNMIFSVCLEKLELEIGEILKARRGLPVTIASLPILYQEMYGKALQANGYHTESQRHAKAGFSLTTLLAQLRNIRLMERPHGQHFVVLVEDAPKYMEVRGERNGYGASSSHQIYLTFPAESTFTDAEVQNYFNQFGPVHDVRIPRQEKRMFGFVSFYHPQTARKILAMGHPHIIGGARVLVKPYKEKSRLVERKQADKVDAQKCPSSFSFDMDKDLVSRQISCDTSKLHIKQQIEDLQPVFDLKTRHFLEHQLRQMPLVYGLEEPEILEDQFNSLNITSFNSTDDDSTLEPGGNCSDPDRLQIELPDSPFTSPRFGSNGLYMVA